ncbi:globin [Phenylobacterium sp.]|uniref:globin n=1 Tax=Phenylobacterium sp. TaxID=1871053 RepID=UPI0012028DB2|nr:globin [Phenylobacterium sp.]TAL32116.1 MAG: globin [Phenylobacterium sp.]
MGDTTTDIVTRSLERLAERVGDPTPQVYQRLFARLPQAEARFARDVTGDIKGEMLSMVFGCLMDPAGPYQVNLVKSERVNHDGYGTPNHEFDSFFQIVKETCRDLLGSDWTAAEEEAWNTQIARVTSITQ